MVALDGKTHIFAVQGNVGWRQLVGACRKLVGALVAEHVVVAWDSQSNPDPPLRKCGEFAAYISRALDRGRSPGNGLAPREIHTFVGAGITSRKRPMLRPQSSALVNGPWCVSRWCLWHWSVGMTPAAFSDRSSCNTEPSVYTCRWSRSCSCVTARVSCMLQRALWCSYREMDSSVPDPAMASPHAAGDSATRGTTFIVLHCHCAKQQHHPTDGSNGDEQLVWRSCPSAPRTDGGPRPFLDDPPTGTLPLTAPATHGTLFN